MYRIEVDMKHFQKISKASIQTLILQLAQRVFLEPHVIRDRNLEPPEFGRVGFRGLQAIFSPCVAMTSALSQLSISTEGTSLSRLLVDTGYIVGRVLKVM